MGADAERETRTILFTDMVGSTAMRTALGDVAADSVRRDHDAILRAAIEHHHGVVGKWLGDGVMVVFDSAAAAVECAAEMQERVTDFARRTDKGVAIRVGLSAGDVVEEDGDWYGTPVVEAARLEAAAESGQILVAEIVKQLAGTRTTVGFGPPRDLSLKGLGGPLPACTVLWDRDADPAIDLRADRHLRLVPASAPALVGRADDLAEVARLLDEPSALVTLTGPGGVGKTRLACAAAEEAASTGAFPGGVHFVELASAGPEQVVNAVASSLDVREAPALDLEASVVAHVGGRRMLLILDNCEHVVDAAAQLAHTLLIGAPDVVVLATSQVPLGVGEEVVYGVSPLEVPPERTVSVETATGSPAVQLFVDRARRSNRGFALTDETAPAVAQICRRLDGIPLAIELAAARSRALSPAQIAERLDDRFHLLTGGSRTVVERHQTLLAAVEWSYSLLSEEERRLLARVSSFPGGFDLEAAEQVAADDSPAGVQREDVLDLVAVLVDRSLITTVDLPDGGIRYRLLDTIRSYAGAQLDDRDFELTSEQLLRWAVALADAAEDEIDGAGEDAAFDRVSLEQDNLIAAIGLAEAAGEATSAMTIAAVLAVRLDIVGHFGEGIALCDEVLAWASDDDPFARRRLVLRAGNLALSSGRLDEAHTFYEESLDRARELDDPQGVLSAINNLSITAMWQGNFAMAKALLAQAQVSPDTSGAALAILQVTRAELAIYRDELDEAVECLDEVADHIEEIGSYTIAEAEVLRGTAFFASGRMGDAKGRFEVALEHAGEAEAMEFLALARHGLGLVALEGEDLVESRLQLDRALADARAAGHARALGLLLASIGRLEAVAGDLTAARARLAEALHLQVKMGDRFGVAQTLEGEAAVLALEGDPVGAVRLFGAASSLREQAEAPAWPVDQHRISSAIARLRGAVDDFDALWVEGEASAGPQHALAEIVSGLFIQAAVGAA